MFLWRIILRSVMRQSRRGILIALTVCLSATVSVAMLGIVFDVGDKLNEQLSAYGSNIVVRPKSSGVIADLYDINPAATLPESTQPEQTENTSTSGSTDTQSGHGHTHTQQSQQTQSQQIQSQQTQAQSQAQSQDSQETDAQSEYLKESDIPKIKTIFWAYNITNFAPRLDIKAQIMSGDEHEMGKAVSANVTGTWFNKKLELATGETTVVGLQGMRSWWNIDGAWAKDNADEVMLGKKLAEQIGVSVGDHMMVHVGLEAGTYTVAGIISGDDDANQVFMPSHIVQNLAHLPDAMSQVEVKALTTPENDLARKAAKNPAALTQEEWETWYCTAYASSITYQIEEVLPQAVAKQVRQVSQLQGEVIQKTRAVMIVMTVLSLISATIAVANLMSASISRRAGELALLKSLGASNGALSRLIVLETLLMSAIGAVFGAGFGSLAAQGIGRIVFGTAITMRPMVFLLVAVLLVVSVVCAALFAVSSIVRVQPGQVLHGR